MAEHGFDSDTDLSSNGSTAGDLRKDRSRSEEKKKLDAVSEDSLRAEQFRQTAEVRDIME